MKRSEAIIKETQRAIDKMKGNELIMIVNQKADAVRVANHFRHEGFTCYIDDSKKKKKGYFELILVKP